MSVRWLRRAVRRLAGRSSAATEQAKASVRTGPQFFHLAIGPVQGFVAEARRTRDLWAGSFLLSWLTGCAMMRLPPDARILLPDVDGDPLYQSLQTDKLGHYRPSLPNHFIAEVPADFDPNICVGEVQARWHSLAEAVRKTFFDPVANAGQHSDAIWKRQIGTADGAPPFWEVAWVMVPKSEGLKGALDAMERRKLWRSWPSHTAEPGDMCTLMADWQELSGWSRVRSDEQQKEFWKQLRDGVGSHLGHEEVIDLREGERLCAVALVKRLFPLLPPDTLEKLIGFPTEVTESKKRILDSYRPSTSYLAAAHWMKRADENADGPCRDFVGTVNDMSPALARAERYADLGILDSEHRFGWLDGRLLFEGVYDAETELPMLKDEQKAKPLKILGKIAGVKIQNQHQQAVDEEEDELGTGTVGLPSPYYAILAMDGDEAGKLVSQCGEELPPLLAAFARQVGPIVKTAHHGELIYAGGDDLLALLPLEEVLDAALCLRRAWQGTVTQRLEGMNATISAGIVYAHHQVGLRQALEEARHLLEGRAKDGNGRDSVAVSVFGRNGRACLWVSTWDNGDGSAQIVEGLSDLARRSGSQTRALCSNRFAHGINQRLEGFFSRPLANLADHPRTIELGSEDLASLVRALGGTQASDLGQTDIKKLEQILRPHLRIGEEYKCLSEPLQIDAALLLRFLARQWRRLENDEDARAAAA
ncbi:MAG: type III-B CRISPR-associated protein Cas10/Cmr2 [Geminicoccaceae bacterium]